MSHVVVSNLAYAHPGGELLFSEVSFKISPGQHVGLVGANGVGKSTLFRVLAGELPADEGDVDIGTFAYMPQDVGIRADGRTVRELLLSAAPARLRDAGRRMLAAEREVAAGADFSRSRDAARAKRSATGPSSVVTSSRAGGTPPAGGSSARGSMRSARVPSPNSRAASESDFVLDVLFESDASVLLLDEPDNFLDVPAKVDLERRINASRKTILLISHDRDLLERGHERNPHARSQRGTWMHGGSYRTLPAGPGSAKPGTARGPARAVEARGAPAVPLLQDDGSQRAATSDVLAKRANAPPRRGGGDSSTPGRRRPGRRPADPAAHPWGRFGADRAVCAARCRDRGSSCARSRTRSTSASASG